MEERKLVTIQKIENIEPIEGADNIVLAQIMGWKVIVKKDGLSIGDRCVFFEVDSILPDGEPWSEFLRSKKFRIKTMKLRGVLSQGLALPMDILPEGSGPFKEGDDVTELLNVKKHIPNLHDGGKNMGQTMGNFYPRAPKTDELRLQSYIKLLDEIKDLPLYYTVKCDGTSSTFVYDEEFMVFSRRSRKKEDDKNIYWKVARKYNLEEKLKLNPLMAVQGEVCGPGVQKNNLMLKDYDLFVFDVYDVANGKYLDFNDLINFCHDLDLNMVKVVDIVKDFSKFDNSLNAWLERAKGRYDNTNKHREGIVIRPLKEKYSKVLKGRLSFKVLNNDFLLKEK